MIMGHVSICLILEDGGMIDPLAEKYFPMSPYHMSGNNLIFYVDDNGMNYDDYGIDDNGNVSLIQKTDDNFDRLYKAKSDANGNAVKDANGNAQKETERIGKENKDYVKVDKSSPSDGTIISQLSGKDSSGLSHGTTNNFTDARQVFQFAADNSRVEWSIGGFRIGKENTFLVGTTHLTDKVQAPREFREKGLTYENNIYSGHTHPYSRMPQPHDVGISNPDAYNFIYYTGAGYRDGRENYFVPFSIIQGKDGKPIASPKLNQRQQVKLPNLIK
ncbi:JAB-like toxin 1 domain-containing protein [Chryseobacterium sp. FH2]|uniref:JAB-like toxin 1 domain-containing protein n=1 Tax=Chryseobacterium sp. FH2 TaxID=1674291 RepID=UPI003977D42A